ncbi:MAG TPA: hypothetical protein VFM59_02520 [Salinimicrobium sp.]|nr:hypothetical protein [Salinimicrobium sp.]
MLVNISHDYSSKKKEIDAEVGKTLELKKRKELGGISCSNVIITAASIDIYNLLVLNEHKNTCAIEIRPKGIIITFRSQNDTFALVIPYYKLRIYKGRAEEYSFYRDNQFIKIRADKDDPDMHNFIRKIRDHKSDNAPTRVEDLL